MSYNYCMYLVVYLLLFLFCLLFVRLTPSELRFAKLGTLSLLFTTVFSKTGRACNRVEIQDIMNE